MKKILICFIIAMPLMTCAQEGTVTIIDKVEVFEKIIEKKDIQLVDVRRTAEYKKGFIGNAMHINVLKEKSFKEKVSELDKEKPIYIYCHAGGRSKKASTILLELGFKEVYDFSPGYKGWSKR